MRNSFVISKAFSSFLGAAILTSLATQICGTTDAIIMSQLIGPNAMSAINLCSPIFAAVLSLIPLLSMGSSMRIAVAIGNQKSQEAREIFTSTIFAALGLAFLFGGVIFAMRSTFTQMVCPDETIYPYAYDYLTVWLLGLPIMMVNSLLYNLVSVDGKPKLVSRAVIVSSIVNIILDIIFVKYLGFGIEGGAWATVISMCFGICVMCTHLFSKSCTYKIVNVRKVFWKQLWGNVQKGYSFTLTLLMGAVGCYLLNTIILNALGTTGIFIWSVCNQVTALSNMAISGAAEALFSIGGILIGESDMEGLDRLYRRSQKVMTISVSAFVIIILCIPTVLGSIFGANTPELKEASATPIRLFALSIIPVSIAGVARNVYLLLGHGSLVTSMNFIQMGVQLLILWICSLISGPLIWPGVIIAILITFAIQWGIARYISRKDPYCNHFSLVSQVQNDPSVNVSVPYDEEKLQESMDEIHVFLDVCEVSEDLSYRIQLCCEELLHNIIEHPTAGKDTSFDVHITEKPDSISMVVKDCGKPFNPVREYEEVQFEDLEKGHMNLGLRMFNSSCDNMVYKYLYGQNVVYMTWVKEADTAQQ